MLLLHCFKDASQNGDVNWEANGGGGVVIVNLGRSDLEETVAFFIFYNYLNAHQIAVESVGEPDLAQQNLSLGYSLVIVKLHIKLL